MGNFQGIVLSFVFLLSFNTHALTNSNPAYHDSSNFNVWLTIKGIDNGEVYHGLCNGSLIAPDLVVTAAHCLVGSSDIQDGIDVNVGKYRTIKGTKHDFTGYFSNLDIIKSKKIYFLNAVDKKIRSGSLAGSGNVKAPYDLALIELERPVDQTKVPVQFVEFATAAEYAKVSSNPSNYSFIALSVNLVAEMSSDSRRYVEMNGMQFNGLTNKAYGLPMINPMYPSSTEGGDSGAPVLVNVSGKWKLFAVIKGTKRDFLSTKLEEWVGYPGNITPAVNMFVPVSNKMCELLTQAKRPCL